MDPELRPMTCAQCGTEFGPDDSHCPGCGISRAEAERPPGEDDEVTEASMDSFPASDPPANY